MSEPTEEARLAMIARRYQAKNLDTFRAAQRDFRLEVPRSPFQIMRTAWVMYHAIDELAAEVEDQKAEVARLTDQNAKLLAAENACDERMRQAAERTCVYTHDGKSWPECAADEIKRLTEHHHTLAVLCHAWMRGPCVCGCHTSTTME